MIAFPYKLLAGVLLLAAAALGVAWFGHSRYAAGYDARNKIAIAAEAAISAQARDKLDAATADAATREKALETLVAALKAQREQDEATNAKNLETMRARAAAGTERLSIRAECPARALPGRAAPAEPAAAAGTGGETRADVVPSTAADVFSIAEGIAELVRDYNRVVDLYDAARNTCNGGTTMKN